MSFNLLSSHDMSVIETVSERLHPNPALLLLLKHQAVNTHKPHPLPYNHLPHQMLYASDLSPTDVVETT